MKTNIRKLLNVTVSAYLNHGAASVANWCRLLQTQTLGQHQNEAQAAGGSHVGVLMLLAFRQHDMVMTKLTGCI